MTNEMRRATLHPSPPRGTESPVSLLVTVVAEVLGVVIVVVVELGVGLDVSSFPPCDEGSREVASRDAPFTGNVEHDDTEERRGHTSDAAEGEQESGKRSGGSSSVGGEV